MDDGQKQTADTPPPIEHMSFEQIGAFLSHIDGRTATKCGGALTKRLYEIALYDNHLPEAHREAAHKLRRVIKETMEIVFSHRPEVLAQYRELNAFMESVARYIGVGSLPWLLKENHICGEAEMIEFISRPDHRRLLDAFYVVIGPDLTDQIKAKLRECPEL
jgi:hypothetical protein